jgi:DNA polymerase-3 subunit delta
VVLRNFKDLSNAHKDLVIDGAREVPDSVALVVETPNEKLDTVRLKNMKKAADGRGLSFNFEFLDEAETIERVTSRFKREGYEVEREALDLLVESVGNRLIDLINEVEKICLAAGEQKSVDRELISAVVGKYKTENLFSLLDALEHHEPDVLIRLLDRLIDGGEQPVVVVGMLLKRIVLLLEVKALLAERGSGAPGGRKLAGMMSGAISPWYAEVLGRQAVRFDRPELERLLANLRWADFKLKTTQLEPKYLLEEALVAAHIGKTLASPGISV